MELKQEKAINEHLRDDLKQLESQKYERLGELASELGNVNAINKRLESELERARGELKEGESAISMLQTQLDKKELALAILQTQSQQQLQLTLPLVTDSLDPAVTSEESSANSQELEGNLSKIVQNSPIILSGSEGNKGTGGQRDTQPKTLKCSELADYINQKFNPKKPISKQNLTDAARGASKRMPQLEADYSFKFLGKIRGEYRFKILS